MANTTNFGWETPDDTDLVKDGAAAMRTLGNSIDASFVDLKGGTSGQILSKNSNTDLDFVWIANDQGDITAVTAGTGLTGGGTAGAVTLTNDMATTITASGDIVVGTGSGTYDNLPIGTTGQVLTADTTVSPYKVKWAAPAGGGKVLQVVSAVTTTSTVIASTTYTDTTITATITPSSASSKIMIFIQGTFEMYTTTGGVEIGAKLLRGATSLYDYGNDFAGLRAGLWSNAIILQITAPIMYLDSPATTSAITYKLQSKVENTANSTQVEWQRQSNPSTITLFEIGA